MKTHITWPGQTLRFFAAAEDAMQQLPPAFPLEATVAVNPWLGQTREDRTIAAARMKLVGGGNMFLARETVSERLKSGRITDMDLQEAATAHGIAAQSLRDALDRAGDTARPLPTVAGIAANDTGIDWPALVEDRISHWAGAHFDQGQAFWPAPRVGAWASWQAQASRDLTPAIAGFAGFAQEVQALPTDARTAFAEACETLDLPAEAAPLYFHRLLMTLPGWSQYARHLSWIAERDGTRDATLFELLTIRLAWEAALHARLGPSGTAAWQAAKTRYAQPVHADEDTLIDAALQDAVDRSAERELAETLSTSALPQPDTRSEIQAAFCIDVRSERLRRALEAADHGIRTIGFAGFFGLPVAHRAYASDIVEARAPILLNPGIETRGGAGDPAETAERVRLRAVRAWGRFKRAAVSAFAFVEAAGPLYVGKLLRDALGIAGRAAHAPAPTLDLPLSERVAAAENILRAMSLTRDLAPLVLLCGHGATVTNAPHASALQCGACGGHAGDVNARLLAALLNDRQVRQGLADRQIAVPEDTQFVAGLHDTVSDAVHLYADTVPESHLASLRRLETALARAGLVARTERAGTIPRGTPASLARRGHDWSEVRPEWGLAGCRGFIAAPRARTLGHDLGGQVFLHDYDWTQDKDAATLDLILTAPVVVASWIALQYHGATVAPEMFGAGNKLLHNVVGGIGVLEGNGGPLRAGLPWQSVNDGDAPRHLPSRLIVVVDAPEEMISGVLDRQPQVRALFDNGWLALFTMDGTGGLGRRYRGGTWTARDAAGADELASAA
ncbi:hypothetical protein BOO69_06275 [Sulfitobacter alexandrii]|uniref:Probable inorganic carbon transporter subunit DabA n=1 Tax=Sulfitobacter alexandrii TaxID=1917485 RepID=A0A1J0WFG8_9RHOB|nr:DUF2309 domain-containing protein [Sulfitobacter alexandrii]APE43065.1 hypothetical protein BOO69_06275 [Sulfitobacter alexandrii]